MKTTKVNSIEELKNLLAKEGQVHVADVDFDFNLKPVKNGVRYGFSYTKYEGGIYKLQYCANSDTYYLPDFESVKTIAKEWTR